jgi:hypothetical protein
MVDAYTRERRLKQAGSHLSDADFRVHEIDESE